MASISRECAICRAEFPVAPLQKQHYGDGEEISADTEHGTGQDPQSFPPDEALQTCSESHSLDTCYSCLDLYISTALDTRGPAACDAIECPQPTCHHIYTFDEIKKITSSATFSRCDDLLTGKLLAEDPNFRWCLRPGCGSGATYYAGDVWAELGCRGIVFGADARLTEPGRWIACPECGFGMCFAHQVPCETRFRSWSEQMKDPAWTLSAQGCALCRQELLDRGSEESTDTWLAKNTKPCPRIGCGVRIEKNSGCRHMNCASCNFNFCWNCMGEYDQQGNCCGDCRESGSDSEGEEAGRRNQSRATDFQTSEDIYAQALQSFGNGSGSAMERLRMLEGLGVVANRPTTWHWPPVIVSEDDYQQYQGLGRWTIGPHNYAVVQNRYQQMQAQTISQNERTAQRTMTTGTVFPYPNTNASSRGEHQPTAASTTPDPAPSIFQTIYNQPGTSSYHGPNYANYPRPQSGPSSAPRNQSTGGMHFGSYQSWQIGPQVDYSYPEYGPTLNHDYTVNQSSWYDDWQWTSYSVGPMESLYTPNPTPVPDRGPQSFDRQGQGHQGRSNQGRRRGDARDR